VRELHEETGLRMPEDALIDLGAVAPNSGILAAEVKLFAAIVDESTPAGDVVDVAEIDSFDWHELSDVNRLVMDEDLTDAFTLAALAAAAVRGLVRLEPVVNGGTGQ
jgi:8-oxo-dGTP pyrophosphatase MutT (NUDIX family)